MIVCRLVSRNSRHAVYEIFTCPRISFRSFTVDRDSNSRGALSPVIRKVVQCSSKSSNAPVSVILIPAQINGRQVLVQERLPGVTLGVAWPYLSQSQKESFKEQSREIIRQLHAIKPSNSCQARSHVVRDPNIFSNGRINPLEREILFSDTNTDPDMSFMHNDFTQSNCIVDNDRIVGLIDWEMAGFFGWKTAGEVHRRIKTPQKEHFANITLSEERLRDIMFWNDLYE